MRITFIGHAGLFVETRYGSILCDPWFNPAYFASWFPFPSNEDVDPTKIGRPTYLYLSHLHRDHFDAEQAIGETGIRATILRDNFYSDLLPFFADDEGVIRGPEAGHAVAAPSDRDRETFRSGSLHCRDDVGDA